MSSVSGPALDSDRGSLSGIQYFYILVPRFRGDDVWILESSLRESRFDPLKDCGNDDLCAIIYDAMYKIQMRGKLPKLIASNSLLNNC